MPNSIRARRPSPLVVLVLVVGLVVAMVAGTAAPAAAHAADLRRAAPVGPSGLRVQTPCPTVFTAAFVADLDRRYPRVASTAAVYDTASGCWHHVHQGRVLTTASVIKAQVLGAVLLKAQREGRGLTSWERSQVDPMIRLSYNPETSNLIAHVGGPAGMEASDGAFGATSTVHPSVFGLTSSTAVDRTRVALGLLHGGGGLAQAGRDVAWSYLSTVHPLQEWGISAGVPHGWTVAQKNGFYPATGRGWRVGSSGFVRRDDGDQGYAISVLTEGGGDQATNVALVEEIARRAASVLTVGPAAARPVDRARCTRAASGESWTGVAARLGVPAARAGEVRSTAGGNASPLSGQRACSPDIPAEPRAASSTIGRLYRQVASDLGCDGPDDLVWYAPGGGDDYVWRGGSGRRFRETTTRVDGDYLPLGGDFDGDGCGDVLWYGPGERADTVWYGGASVSTRWTPVSATGYLPRTGDFDGDGRDDVLWYLPGTGRDYVWFGRGRGSFTSVEISVTGAYLPVVGDLDGDGADDIVWYGPGTASDAHWRGRPGRRTFLEAPMVQVSGRYRPVAVDADGDGVDELVWYAPGPAADVRWTGSPAAPQQEGLSIGGDYLPLTGDLDGDGYGDVAWYGPGGGPEVVWWGGPTGVTSGPLAR